AKTSDLSMNSRVVFSANSTASVDSKAASTRFFNASDSFCFSRVSKTRKNSCVAPIRFLQMRGLLCCSLDVHLSTVQLKTLQGNAARCVPKWYFKGKYSSVVLERKNITRSPCRAAGGQVRTNSRYFLVDAE